MVLRNVASLRTTGVMSVAEIVATHIDYTSTGRVKGLEGCPRELRARNSGIHKAIGSLLCWDRL